MNVYDKKMRRINYILAQCDAYSMLIPYLSFVILHFYPIIDYQFINKITPKKKLKT